MTRDELLFRICPGYRTPGCFNGDTSINCNNCNHELNEMLDEYDKHVIDKYKADTNLKDTIREIHDNVAQEMYCKGIDDMCKAISTYRMYDEYGNVLDVLGIAQKLKAGVNNE